MLHFLILAVLALVASVASSSSNKNKFAFLISNSTNDTEHYEHFKMAELDFERVQTPISVALWLFCVALARIGFHQNNKLPAMVPESCLLIILGVIAGLVFNFVGLPTSGSLNPDFFFLFLLPPIVLEAGFFMNIRALFDNLGTVALFAVFGTIFNSVTIGVSLYMCSATVLGLMDISMTILDAMLFASLIAAVDPVAVLAVFQEIHVNEELYIMVFGESLFNDAVSVVLFNMFYKLALLRVHGEIWVSDWVQAVASLFVVGVVGAIIGMVFAVVTAFITKYTEPIRVLEPLFAFLMAYLAYLTAELFHFSGILAAVFCGMMMKPYIQANISAKSYTTVKYFLKMLSSVCESIVFMLMGRATVDSTHRIDLSFIGLTLLFCLVYRALGVVSLTWVINRFRTIRLGKVDQFVMAYGGLRGAIAMSLALLIPVEASKFNSHFVTCTIAIVYFTVFFQGITIKPLVNWLKVKKKQEIVNSMNAELHLRVMDYVMAGIEDLVGIRGHNAVRVQIERINMKYLAPLLLRDGSKTRETGIMNVISKLNMKEAIDFVATHGSMQTYNRDSVRPDVEPLPIEKVCTPPKHSPQHKAKTVPSKPEAINNWRNAILLARHAAWEASQQPSCSSTENLDTKKILKENLFKEPQYYRVPHTANRLRMNESFISPSKLVKIKDHSAAAACTGPNRDTECSSSQASEHKNTPPRRGRSLHNMLDAPDAAPVLSSTQGSRGSSNSLPTAAKISVPGRGQVSKSPSAISIRIETAADKNSRPSEEAANEPTESSRMLPDADRHHGQQQDNPKLVQRGKKTDRQEESIV